MAFADTAPAAGGTSGGPACDSNIRAGVSAQVDAATAARTNYQNNQLTPPAPLSQLSNQPCMSKELNRITKQFSYAPTRYANNIMGQALSAAGPVGGILQNLFKSEISSINAAAASLPKMLNFQGLASEALGGLMSSLGIGGDAFSSELCGLMVDMVLKYVQCENPIKMPSLGDLFGNLNNLLPNNCAGNALRSTLYAAGNSQALKSYNQPVLVQSGGSTGSGASGVAMPTGTLQLAR